MIDSEDGTLEALKFSLASDFVELVILTTDSVFLRTLREALGDAKRLWHVQSADKVSDLLVAGQVGILVLDAQALHEAANLFVEHIKRQFPDLVVVAAGHRNDETALAGIISSGLVYRFIHKPMSPGRARLFAEAAIRKYQEQRRRAAESPKRRRAAEPSRIWLISAAVAAAAVIAAIAVIDHDSPEKSAATAPEPTARAAETTRAEQADIHERQMAHAQNAFLEQLKAAQLKAPQSQPRQPTQPVPLAQAQSTPTQPVPLAQAQPTATQSVPLATQPPSEAAPRDKPPPQAHEDHLAPLPDPAARPVVAEGHMPDPDRADALREVTADAWGSLLKNANERLLQDRLIEPANDNAKFFYLALKQLDPSNAALGPLLHDLGNRLTSKARRALILGEYDAAKAWVDEAAVVGFDSAELSSANRDLDVVVAKQNFMRNLVPSSELKLVKSAQPVYPSKAQGKVEGWVDVEYTVSENGKVQDVAVRAASVPGTFEDAAVKAVSQWRYQPVLRDAKPVAVRTQIRVRFSLS